MPTISESKKHNPPRWSFLLTGSLPVKGRSSTPALDGDLEVVRCGYYCHISITGIGGSLMIK